MTVLINAWRQVRENGLASRHRRTVEEIKTFDRESHRHLSRVQSQLRENRFTFDSQVGVLLPRPGKKPRPIVIASVKNRVVHRALLDVLQTTDEICELLATATSFGGIAGRGRDSALSLAYQEIETGRARYYIRSDIKEFFTKIPRDKALATIGSFVNDQHFMRLLRSATETELANLAQLHGDAEYFPIHEIGVAQGCALSPLLGNLVLYDFDRLMNDRGIVCVRYIDDFLLLGPERHSVFSAFGNACKTLGSLGLTAYDPRDLGGKAVCGEIDTGFEFLGCDVRPGLIQPSRSSRNHIRERIRDIVEGCRQRMNTVAGARRLDVGGLAQALCEVNNVARGWAHSHSFCNGQDVVATLEGFIDEQITEMIEMYKTRSQNASREIRWRLLGVQALTDVEREPIVGRRSGVLA